MKESKFRQWSRGAQQLARNLFQTAVDRPSAEDRDRGINWMLFAWALVAAVVLVGQLLDEPGRVETIAQSELEVCPPPPPCPACQPQDKAGPLVVEGDEPEQVIWQGPVQPTLVDLNTATQSELEGLPGVGPTTARRIIAARERRPFRRIRHLSRVRGIGPTKLRELAPLVTVGQ